MRAGWGWGRGGGGGGVELILSYRGDDLWRKFIHNAVREFQVPMAFHLAVRARWIPIGEGVCVRGGVTKKNTQRPNSSPQVLRPTSEHTDSLEELSYYASNQLRQPLANGQQ